MPWKPAGEVWFIAGEDTEQNAVAGVIRQGWGLFRLTGTTLAELQADEVGKLVPDSFVTAEDNPENYGCGVLPRRSRCGCASTRTATRVRRR